MARISYSAAYNSSTSQCSSSLAAVGSRERASRGRVAFPRQAQALRMTSRIIIICQSLEESIALESHMRVEYLLKIVNYQMNQLET